METQLEKIMMDSSNTESWNEGIGSIWVDIMANPVLTFLIIKVVIPLIIIAAGIAAAKAISGAAGRSMKKAGMDELIRTFLMKLIKMACIVLIAMTVLAFLGVPVTSFIAVIGSLGFAMALACKDALSNLVGGVSLLVSHPFNKGDYIDDMQVKGTVEEMDLFYCVLRDDEGNKVIVPNSRFVIASIINKSEK